MPNTLLRTLVSEMIETHLEESYEDNLIESIFEEVSEETWGAIEEAILNELSPATLKNYIKKAADDAAVKKSKHDSANRDYPNDAMRRKKILGSIIDRRRAGISKALDKLTK